jgi:hypothetical protein
LFLAVICYIVYLPLETMDVEMTVSMMSNEIMTSAQSETTDALSQTMDSLVGQLYLPTILDVIYAQHKFMTERQRTHVVTLVAACLELRDANNNATSKLLEDMHLCAEQDVQSAPVKFLELGHAMRAKGCPVLANHVESLTTICPTALKLMLAIANKVGLAIHV